MTDTLADLSDTTFGQRFFSLRDSLDLPTTTTCACPRGQSPRLRLVRLPNGHTATAPTTTAADTVIAALGLAGIRVGGGSTRRDSSRTLPRWPPGTWFGGLRAYLDGIFDDKVFVSSRSSEMSRQPLGHRVPRELGVGRPTSPRVSYAVLLSGTSPTSPSGGTCSMPDTDTLGTQVEDGRAAVNGRGLPAATSAEQALLCCSLCRSGARAGVHQRTRTTACPRCASMIVDVLSGLAGTSQWAAPTTTVQRVKLGLENDSGGAGRRPRPSTGTRSASWPAPWR